MRSRLCLREKDKQGEVDITRISLSVASGFMHFLLIESFTVLDGESKCVASLTTLPKANWSQLRR